MSVHVCRVDYSAETGSLVACTCGFALGPFTMRERAAEVAREHRRVHLEERKPTPEQRERYLEAQRRRRAEGRR